MAEERLIMEELLSLARARESILEYIDYMSDSGLLDFDKTPQLHHRMIAEVLENLIDPEHPDDRAAISLPPGAAKSFYASIVFPTWVLARNPLIKILCVSNAESLANDFSYRRRQILESPEWQRLAETSLMPDAKSLSFQGLPEGGGIYTRGAGSTASGLRCDLLICDDLIASDEQAGSREQLDKLFRWYMREARPRLRKGGVELMIGTTWSAFDPISRVVKLTEQGKENWHFFRVPLHCDDPDNDPIGRELGALLWPEWYKPREKEIMRDEFVYRTLYQQKPIVGTHTWCPREHIHVKPRAEFPPHLRHYLAADLALSAGKNDYTVFAVIGVDEDKNMYLIDLYRAQVDSSESARVFVNLCEQFRPSVAWIDNDNASRIWARLVREEARKKSIAAPLRFSKLGGRNKEERANNLRGLFYADRVFIAEADWTLAVLDEISEFPESTHDDIVDALALAPKELHLWRGPALPAVARKHEPIKGSLQKMADGSLKTTQTLDQIIRDNPKAPVLCAGHRMRI